VASGNAYNIGADLKLEPGAYKFKLTVKDQISARVRPGTAVHGDPVASMSFSRFRRS